jgi:hypothetical protein
LAEPGASAAQAWALPPGELAASDVAAVPQQEAVAWDAAEEPQQEAVAWAGAAAQRPEAARDAAGVLPRVARPSALPSGVPWVFPRGQLRRPARPPPQPAARFARAMACFRIASP